jgi:hypothetical protein
MSGISTVIRDGTRAAYGKPVLGFRLSINDTLPRLPFTSATAFGVETARRYAESLGEL